MTGSPSSPRKPATRIAVIGGGVIGLACALELRRRGAEVSVYERGTELGAGASMRAAGMLGVGFGWGMEEDSRALAGLALRTGELWPEFAARVEKQGGGSIELSEAGSIVVARNAGEAAWLEKQAVACQARGLPARLISPTELKRVEPAVTGAIRSALQLPGDQQVEAPMLLQRLGAALQRMGVGLKLGRAVARVTVGPGFQLPDGDRFDRVLLATGAGAAVRFASQRDDRYETGLAAIIPVKGQMLALAPVDGAPRHVVHTRDVYVAPKSRWILVGATVERGKADTVVDAAAIGRLREQAGDLVGALREAPEVGAWAGVRPGTPDNAPMMGETRIPGVFAALGHYRNGILFAPATAELVAGMILDGQGGREAAAFDPQRFSRSN